MLMELSSASNSMVNACLLSLSVMVPKLAGLSFDELSLWYRGVCVGSLAWLVVSSLLHVCAPNFLPLGLSSLRDPALSQSPYFFSPAAVDIGFRQSLASWPSMPQLKHSPNNRLYWKAIRTLTPSELSTGAPLYMSLSSGSSTQIRRKRAWSAAISLQSMSRTLPMLPLISFHISSLMRSKGSPQTCTQIGTNLKSTVKAVIPFSHRRNSSKWLSKLYGPLFRTQFNWFSIENLNCNNPSPTSVIFKSWAKFPHGLEEIFGSPNIKRFRRMKTTHQA